MADEQKTGAYKSNVEDSALLSLDSMKDILWRIRWHHSPVDASLLLNLQ